MDWLFIIFAVLTLVPATLTATSKNPVSAAMNMIVSFVSLAALMVMLETYFLAVLQVLVYAGAIVVLFLFIIMLIDAEKAPTSGALRTIASIVAFLLMSFGMLYLFFGEYAMETPVLTEATMKTVQVFGVELFTRYMLPFQVAGFMLLIAMVGVIVLSKAPAKEVKS
jgi:NADH-quinone oxidoreductase subunit J